MTTYKILSVCEESTLCPNCNKECLNCLKNFVDDYDFIIFDLAILKTINSFVLSKIRPYMSKSIIYNPSESSKNVLNIMKVDTIIKICKSLEDALSYIDSLQMSI